VFTMNNKSERADCTMTDNGCNIASDDGSDIADGKQGCHLGR
jgi:hypothetical protein